MAQPLQRNMSYRKPVPVYIPSPPLSPDTASASTSPPEVEATGNDFPPPLPENWREVLKTKMLEIKALKMNDLDGLPWNEKTQTPVEELDIIELATFGNSPKNDRPQKQMTTDGDQDSLVAPSTLGEASLSVQKKQSRGLPTQYRPPTPPLPSQTRRQNPTPEPSIGPDLHQFRGVYPSGFFPAPSRTLVGNPSLKPSSSFRTERTMVSLGPTAWSYGLGSDGGGYSSPTLLRKQSIGVLSVSDRELDSSEGACRCWGLLDFFNVKKLWCLGS